MSKIWPVLIHVLVMTWQVLILGLANTWKVLIQVLVKIWPVLKHVMVKSYTKSCPRRARLDICRGQDLASPNLSLGIDLAFFNTNQGKDLASPNASLSQDLVNLNPSFGQFLAPLSSTLGRLKISWKWPRATFLNRNVKSTKNKKKTKCNFDYIKTK